MVFHYCVIDFLCNCTMICKEMTSSYLIGFLKGFVGCAELNKNVPWDFQGQNIMVSLSSKNIYWLFPINTFFFFFHHFSLVYWRFLLAMVLITQKWLVKKALWKNCSKRFCIIHRWSPFLKNIKLLKNFIKGVLLLILRNISEQSFYKTNLNDFHLQFSMVW